MNDKNFEYVPKWNTKDKNVTLNNLLNDLKIPRWNQTKVNRLLLIGFGGIGDEFLVARFGKQMREFAKELDYSSSNYLAHIIVKTNFFDKTWNIKYAPRNFEINNEVNLNNFSYYDSWYSPFHNKMEFLPNDLKYTWQNQIKLK